MNNLIVTAFAFKEGYNTSIQLSKKAGKDTTEMYLKNLYVALVSAKKNNPSDDVCLCVNVLPDSSWIDAFKSNGIDVREMPFDSFIMPKNFPWALAFYKLCVLEKITSEGRYDNVLLLDADTYTVHSFDDLWAESEKGVLLYPLGHSINHPDRNEIIVNFNRLYPERKAENIVHYGGEFICGSKSALAAFIKECGLIFDKIANSGFNVEERIGDEDIFSIAASFKSDNYTIYPANPYVFRFWTEKFYLVSSVTVSNPVSVWHLPSEKATGMLRMYKYFLRKKVFPSIRKSAKLLGITGLKRPCNFVLLGNKINGKLKKIFGKGFF